MFSLTFFEVEGEGFDFLFLFEEVDIFFKEEEFWEGLLALLGEGIKFLD